MNKLPCPICKAECDINEQLVDHFLSQHSAKDIARELAKFVSENSENETENCEKYSVGDDINNDDECDADSVKSETIIEPIKEEKQNQVRNLMVHWFLKIINCTI